MFMSLGVILCACLCACICVRESCILWSPSMCGVFVGRVCVFVGRVCVCVPLGCTLALKGGQLTL